MRSLRKGRKEGRGFSVPTARWASGGYLAEKETALESNPIALASARLPVYPLLFPEHFHGLGTPEALGKVAKRSGNADNREGRKEGRARCD